MIDVDLSDHFNENEFTHGDFYDDDRDFAWLRTPDELHSELFRRIYDLNEQQLKDLLQYIEKTYK